MDSVLAFFTWFAETGTNELVSGIVLQNSLILVPAGMIAYAWLKSRAAKTEATWDDELVEELGDRLGLNDEKDDEDAEK